MTQEMTTLRSWDRQPDETPKAFQAFQTYIMMPIYGEGSEKRSLANLAAKLGLASTSGVELWSGKYNWQERALAYDNYRASAAITISETVLKEFQQNTVTTLGNQLVVMNEVIDRAWASIRERQQSGINVDPAEIKKLTETVKVKDDLARRLAKMPTQFTSEKAEETNDEEIVYTIGGN